MVNLQKIVYSWTKFTEEEMFWQSEPSYVGIRKTCLGLEKNLLNSKYFDNVKQVLFKF